MSNKKLLFIINHLDWFWSHRLPLAQGAQKAGWNVSVAVTGASKDQRLKEGGFRGLELPPSEQGFGPLTLLSIIWGVHRLMAKEKPDLVHAITLKYAFITGLAGLFHKNVKLVHTIAGLGYLFSSASKQARILRFLIGPLLKLALKRKNTQIIFQNPDDQALLIKCGFVSEAQCHLIRGSGVNISQFEAVPEPDIQPPLIIMPTRLVRDKGISVFVEAARIIKARGLEARFQIAGGVTANNPLAISQSQMEQMVANGAAEWLGKISDMPKLFADCAFVVYPSYYREGIPKVLLEACATGRPIITTDHPGCREAVDHKGNGLLVPVKDAEATADAIEFLLKDPALRKAMGEKSRQKAEAEFDVDIIVAQTLSVYNKP